MSYQGFQPCRGMFLQIGETYFEFLPHPLFRSERDAVFRLEGSTAFIYKILDINTNELYALKVFKPTFRHKTIAAVNASLAHYTDIPALQGERRLCITKTTHQELTRAYPELEYAILMPWISAPTWAGLLLNSQFSSTYTSQQALSLARAAAGTFQSLENHGLAHADIAGDNLVPILDRLQIQLLDLENVYIPGIVPPEKKSQGTPGYQHKQPGPHGQWCPEGDRFAGAILLTEMLTWWNPRVRACVAEEVESLFQPYELQTSEAPCLQAVRNTLYTLHPQLLELFDQAWLSRNLADCPLLRSWMEVLSSNTIRNQ